MHKMQNKCNIECKMKNVYIYTRARDFLFPTSHELNKIQSQEPHTYIQYNHILLLTHMYRMISSIKLYYPRMQHTFVCANANANEDGANIAHSQTSKQTHKFMNQARAYINV